MVCVATLSNRECNMLLLWLSDVLKCCSMLLSLQTVAAVPLKDVGIKDKSILKLTLLMSYPEPPELVDFLKYIPKLSAAR